MKKRLLSVAIVMLPFLGFAQIGGSVVYDPTQAMNMTTQINNTATQINQLEKSLKYMEKAEEKLSKVSGFLRDVEDLRRILDLHKRCFEGAKKARIYAGTLNPQRQRIVVDNITNSLKSANSSVTLINKVLTNNFFHMSDKDRMDLIARERVRVSLSYAHIRKYASRVR